tara:strand:- start:2764 stop:2970 length:207 start_codon:yes stop_codon:yes gene_type:complete
MINILKNMTLTQFLKNAKTFTGDYTMAMKPKKMMRGGGVGGGMVKPMRSGGGVGGSVVKGAVKKGKKK